MGLRSWFGGLQTPRPWEDAPVLTVVAQVPVDIAQRLAECDLSGAGFASLGLVHVEVRQAVGYAQIWRDETRPLGIAVNNRPDNRANKVLRPGTYQLCLPAASPDELLAEHRRQRVAHLVGTPLVFQDLADVTAVQDRIHRAGSAADA